MQHEERRQSRWELAAPIKFVARGPRGELPCNTRIDHPTSSCDTLFEAARATHRQPAPLRHQLHACDTRDNQHPLATPLVVMVRACDTQSIQSPLLLIADHVASSPATPIPHCLRGGRETDCVRPYALLAARNPCWSCLHPRWARYPPATPNRRDCRGRPATPDDPPLPLRANHRTRALTTAPATPEPRCSR